MFNLILRSVSFQRGSGRRCKTNSDKNKSHLPGRQGRNLDEGLVGEMEAMMLDRLASINIKFLGRTPALAMGFALFAAVVVTD